MFAYWAIHKPYRSRMSCGMVPADRAGVQQWAHTAAQPFALRHEAAYPIPVAQCGIVVHLPIQRHDAVTPIVRRVPVEELGFRLRVASHRVVVQAEFLAAGLCLGDHAVGVRVDAGHETVVIHLSRAPCGADHHEVRLRVVRCRCRTASWTRRCPACPRARSPEAASYRRRRLAP